jgi:hypothetical protein
LKYWLGTIAKYLVVTLVIVYLLDWGVFAVRASRGNGTAVVQVDQYLATPLKGNKEEYDYLGTAPVTCSKSLFPHGGLPVCWWVQRHKDHWE